MKKTKLGLGWLIPGVVIVANPVVAFYDILPDSIGCLLICVALFRLADLNSSIADALKRFRTLIWINIGTILMQYYIYNVLAKQPNLKPQERSSARTCLASAVWTSVYLPMTMRLWTKRLNG